jgi:hypothetical protein
MGTGCFHHVRRPQVFFSMLEVIIRVSYARRRTPNTTRAGGTPAGLMARISGQIYGFILRVTMVPD